MPANRKPKAWNLKPQMTAAPDLWRGLSFFVYQFDDAKPREFFGTKTSLVGTEYGRSTTQNGKFGKFRNTTSGGACGIEWENRHTWNVASSQITAFCLMQAETASTDSGNDRRIWDGTNANANNIRCFLINSGANAVRWRTLASSGVNVDISASWSAGDFLLYVGTYDGSTAKLYFFNLTTGTKQTNSAPQSGNIGSESGQACLGNIVNGTLPASFILKADIGFFGISKEAWTDLEVDLLRKDPFAMLRPAGF